MCGVIFSFVQSKKWHTNSEIRYEVHALYLLVTIKLETNALLFRIPFLCFGSAPRHGTVVRILL